MNSDQKFRCDLIIDVDGGDKVFHSNIDGVYSTAISSTSTSVLQYFFDPSGPSCYKREVVSGTSTDTTYNTINEWTILYSDDTISGGNTYPAYKVSFDNTDTDLESVNVQDVILELEENFQDGVDAVYDAVVAKGSTPTSHSLSDVVTGIGNIETGITPSGTLSISTNGTHDVTNYASASVDVPASSGTPSVSYLIDSYGSYVNTYQYWTATRDYRVVAFCGYVDSRNTSSVSITRYRGNFKICRSDPWSISVSSSVYNNICSGVLIDVKKGDILRFAYYNGFRLWACSNN